MKCIYCNSELTSNANFCYKCRQQVRCMICKATLVKDALICIECGKPINQSNTNNGAINNIEISEDANGRKLTASFTDNVAESVARIFVNDFNFKKQPSIKGLSVSSTVHNNEVEDIEMNEVTIKPMKSDELTTLERIFRNRNGEISIDDTRIKAKNKSDSVSRISLLYLYYKELQGEQEIDRIGLNNFLKQEKFDENTFRVWLSSAGKKLVDNKKTYLCLRQEGKEKAKQIIAEFLDPNIPNVYDFKSSSHSKGKKDDAQNTTNGKSKTKTSITPKIVSELNLNPKGKESLIEFYKKYSLKKDAAEHNLFFIYYLERVLGEKSISLNHIYTCYKEVKKQFPNNLYQSLINTKNRSGWIDTSDTNNLKITTAGENHVEHKIKKSS